MATPTRVETEDPVAGGRQDRALVRRLRLETLAALGLLGLLALGGYLVLRADSRTLSSAARTIDASGRQRMLSQRAALLAQRLPATAEPERRRAIREEIRSLAGELELHHRGLLAPAAGAPPVPASARAILLGPPHRLDRQIREYVAALRLIALPSEGPASMSDPGMRYVVQRAESATLLASLDALVEAMRLEAEEDLHRLRRVQLLIVLLFFALLAGLAAFLGRSLLRGLAGYLAELRQREAQLRERRRQLRLIFRNAPLGIAACDAHGFVVEANPALCDALGLEAGEVGGRSLSGLLQPDEPRRLSAAVDRALSGEGGVERAEAAFTRPDGSRVAGVVHLAGTAAGTGPIRLVAHFEDRTEVLSAEDEARQHRERLAQVARLNTMGDLATGIAHEINQPLTAISSYAQSCRLLANQGRLSSGALVAALDKVSAQVQRAGRVLRHLRDFVRRRRSEAEVADVNALVEEAVELARAEARFRDRAIATRLDAGLPAVIVDTVQVQQVILNLIQNALEASEGAGDEAMLVRTGGNGDGFVEVAVVDHGPGLEPEVAERLFEPFFSTKPSGLGLGLSISRSIVASHGGRLWHSANPGGGATFHFTLPAAPRPAGRGAGAT